MHRLLKCRPSFTFLKKNPITDVAQHNEFSLLLKSLKSSHWVNSECRTVNSSSNFLFSFLNDRQFLSPTVPNNSLINAENVTWQCCKRFSILAQLSVIYLILSDATLHSEYHPIWSFTFHQSHSPNQLVGFLLLRFWVSLLPTPCSPFIFFSFLFSQFWPFDLCEETVLQSAIAKAELGTAAHWAFFFILPLSFSHPLMRNETEALVIFARWGGISAAAPP